MPPALDLRRLESPVVQAGMGTVARHELAAAVSAAGGLGTIAGARAPIAAQIAKARNLTDRPIAVNLLLPFLRAGDAEAAGAADVIVTFWGAPRRARGSTSAARYPRRRPRRRLALTPSSRKGLRPAPHPAVWGPGATRGDTDAPWLTVRPWCRAVRSHCSRV
jgi:hypothetical protein